jgi:hypothetical protein
MISLKQSLGSWNSEAFERNFCAEVEGLPTTLLPLQQCLALSSAVADEPFRVVVIAAGEEPEVLRVKAGIFYSGVIAGCNCADDPTPPDLQQEYCELEFVIEKASASARVRRLDDE